MEKGIICFTMNGYVLAEETDRLLKKSGHRTEVFAKSRYLRDVDAIPVKDSLKLWTQKMFETKDAILFIGASGIAVRAIAPYVEDKKYDPDGEPLGQTA